jgi:hypothetical protein
MAERFCNSFKDIALLGHDYGSYKIGNLLGRQTQVAGTVGVCDTDGVDTQMPPSLRSFRFITSKCR